MFTYCQSTGELTHNDGLQTSTVGYGYSGHGHGLNNPDAQGQEGVGPIPVGSYTIGPPKDPVDHLGPIAMPLEPSPDNDMMGRSAFFMHGDNASMNHTASDGCIIMSRDIREYVRDAAQGGDNTLTVIA